MTEPEKLHTTASMDIQPLSPDANAGGKTKDGDGAAPTTSGEFPIVQPSAGPDEFAYLDPPQAPDEIGRLSGYRILRVLGRGGMGVVFEAEDPMLSRRVAIKVPTTQITSESHRKRFIREARVAATLSNEHIAAIYQAGQHGSVPFLIMEMLRGEPLDSRLDREKTLPVGEALRIAREIAEGLREAHGHGLVHRDIKPANIWLEQRAAHQQGPPRAKILDFGLAREAEPKEGITTVGNIVGTMGYMAPEQVYAGQIDGRTDLFTLGCVLYEMLTGKLPFKGSNTVDSLKAVVYEQPESIALAAPQLPGSVVRLVNDLLQKEPASRPASAEIVVERIRQIERELTSGGIGIRPQETPAVSSRRHSWGILFGVGALAVAVIVGGIVLFNKLRVSSTAGPDRKIDSGASAPVEAPIKIGILHSRSGVLASTEAPVAEATVFAIKQINQAGGIRGRQIEWVSEDGRSTEEGFAAGAEKLIQQDHVAAIFGCWTSSSRKRVEEVCRKADNMLVYPINYEGLEDSPYVMYVGGAPNQELVPAVSYAIGAGKHRFFLVGSDHVYSHACNEIIRAQLKEKFKHAECAGEEYVPLHETASSKFAAIAKQIKESGADVIFSTVDGHQANVNFFHALAAAGVTAKESPVFSFSFFEDELRNLDERDTIGHYSVACYFESIDSPENKRFLKQFKAAYETSVVTDPMEAAYCGVYLWKAAVLEAGDERPANVRPAMAHQKFEAPEGLIAMDPANHHAIRSARIGHVVNNREFEIVFSSPKPLLPEPFPSTRPRKDWDSFLQKLYRDWGNRWEAPAR